MRKSRLGSITDQVLCTFTLWAFKGTCTVLSQDFTHVLNLLTLFIFIIKLEPGQPAGDADRPLYSFPIGSLECRLDSVSVESPLWNRCHKQQVCGL